MDPAEIRKLASVPLTEQLKHYQEMIDEPLPEKLTSNEEGDNEGVNPMVNRAYTPPSETRGAWSTRLVVVNNPDSYFWMRQQVAYDKQVVVLAPVAQYQPGTPQTQTFVRSVQPATAQIQTFEQKNPETKTWAHSYSQSPVRQAKVAQVREARVRAYGPRVHGKSANKAFKPRRGRWKKRWG